MSDAISQFEKKPARYELIDGTYDLNFGIFFPVWALLIRMSEGTRLGWRWFAMVYGVNAAAFVVVLFGTRYIRRRLVYSRSGYMKFRKRPWVLVSVVALSVISSAALTLWFAKPRSVLSAPLLIGLLMGLVLLLGALQRRVPRLAMLAMLSVAIGFAVQFIEPWSGYEKSILLRNAAGAFWYFLLMGTAFLISGALTLYSYVRCMPPRDVEAEMPRSEQL